MYSIINDLTTVLVRSKTMTLCRINIPGSRRIFGCSLLCKNILVLDDLWESLTIIWWVLIFDICPISYMWCSSVLYWPLLCPFWSNRDDLLDSSSVFIINGLTLCLWVCLLLMYIGLWSKWSIFSGCFVIQVSHPHILLLHSY